jgi:hypothetical protein
MTARRGGYAILILSLKRISFLSKLCCNYRMLCDRLTPIGQTRNGVAFPRNYSSDNNMTEDSGVPSFASFQRNTCEYA